MPCKFSIIAFILRNSLMKYKINYQGGALHRVSAFDVISAQLVGLI